MQDETYLSISEYVALESLCRNGEVCMNGLPVFKKGFVGNRVQLFEENRYFDTRLEIGL